MDVKYNTVCPYLLARDVISSVDFLIKVFGGTVLEQLKLPNGTLQHAEVMVGDTVIMLGRLADDMPEAAPFGKSVL